MPPHPSTDVDIVSRQLARKTPPEASRRGMGAHGHTTWWYPLGRLTVGGTTPPKIALM